MGYAEIAYGKEDHIALHYPPDVVPGGWEIGFLGYRCKQASLSSCYRSPGNLIDIYPAEIWLRSLIHYI